MGQDVGTATQNKSDPLLVGEVNETMININGKEVKSLLDTGSCVSTCSEQFYHDYFSDIELKPLKNLLKVECADGSELPYLGFIEVNILPIGIVDAHEQTCLLLVVPNTNFNSNTPVLLGTNVLQHFMDACSEIHGKQFLQKAKLHSPWYLAFRCMSVREKELKKNNYRLAILRNAESRRITVTPNQSVKVKCFTDNEIGHIPTSALICETDSSLLPGFIDIGPGVIQYNSQGKQLVEVTLSNLSTNSVNISPKAIIAELQPVEVESFLSEEMEPELKTNDVLSKVKIESNLSQEQYGELMDLLHTHENIFFQERYRYR